MGDDRPLSEIARPAGIGASLFCSVLLYRYMVVNAGSERFVYVLIRWRARWRRSPHAVSCIMSERRESGPERRARGLQVSVIGVVCVLVAVWSTIVVSSKSWFQSQVTGRCAVNPGVRVWPSRLRDERLGTFWFWCI